MFENFANLDVEKHKELKFEPSTNLNFAATTATAPIAASEVSKAMRQFPIAFTVDEPILPVAFMSLISEKNAFVDAEGQWKGDYLPAHIRRFPFILGNTDDPDKFTVMFDTDAPEINTISGQPLYEENGDAAPALQEAVNFLQAFQHELSATQDLVRPLVEKDVLSVQNISVNRPDGSVWQFEGVNGVDGDKVKALDDATLAEWTRSGLMAIVYAHFNSMENVRYIAERQGLISQQD